MGRPRGPPWGAELTTRDQAATISHKSLCESVMCRPGEPLGPHRIAQPRAIALHERVTVPAQRRQRILQAVRSGTAHVSELARAFEVSEMTVRRDLRAL